MLGTIGCFSFFPSKNLGAFGDAGAVTCEDDAIVEKLVDFRVHGMRPKYYHRYVGGNFRIDALQAAILHVKLPHLDALDRRPPPQRGDATRSSSPTRNSASASCCRASCRSGGTSTTSTSSASPMARARDRVMDHLKSAGIGCEVYYPLTLPQQECFRNVDAAADQASRIPTPPRRRRWPSRFFRS